MKKRDYRKRYGNPQKYRVQCAIAHKSVHGLCCVCLTAQSQELHHASYGKDCIGISVFPVCVRCHQSICHAPDNWIIDFKNPVWGNHNSAEFTQRLQLGYKLLYGGIDHVDSTNINRISKARKC